MTIGKNPSRNSRVTNSMLGAQSEAGFRGDGGDLVREWRQASGNLGGGACAAGGSNEWLQSSDRSGNLRLKWPAADALVRQSVRNCAPVRLPFLPGISEAEIEPHGPSLARALV